MLWETVSNDLLKSMYITSTGLPPGNQVGQVLLALGEVMLAFSDHLVHL